MRAAIFDLGNVVLFFSHDRMCRQLGACFGLAADAVERCLFETGFVSRYDLGEASTDEMFALLSAAGTRCPSLREARSAAADIFEPNTSLVPILDALEAAGVSLIALSNTCEVHATHVRETYDVLEKFDRVVLSYEVGRTKPDPEIYAMAVAAADCDPSDCFFTDDVAEYVEAARTLGIDAEVFRGAAELTRDLLERGCDVTPAPGARSRTNR